jgi:hypothetical protein
MQTPIVFTVALAIFALSPNLGWAQGRGGGFHGGGFHGGGFHGGFNLGFGFRGAGWGWGWWGSGRAGRRVELGSRLGLGPELGRWLGLGPRVGLGLALGITLLPAPPSIANDRDRPFDSRMALSKMTCRGNLS